MFVTLHIHGTSVSLQTGDRTPGSARKRPELTRLPSHWLLFMCVRVSAASSVCGRAVACEAPATERSLSNL